MSSLRLFVLALWCLLAGPSTIGTFAHAAGTFAKTDKVELELIAELEAAVPGEPMRLALRQTIAPGWHTYWLNPGDSGAPTRLDWVLPEGVTVSSMADPAAWPLPRAIPYFDLMNYGYEDEVVFLAELQVPESWPVGEPLEIALAADWLVCADICIPERADLSIGLPTRQGPPIAHPANAALFEKASAARPRPVPWPATFAVDGDETMLTLEGDFSVDAARVTEVHFFPAEGDVIAHAAAQRSTLDENGLQLRLTTQADGPFAASDARERNGRAARLEGVLTLIEDLPDGTLRQGFLVQAEPAALPAEAALFGASFQTGTTGLLQAVLFAFLGGLILNAMPCVFPVLSIKALALVRHAGEPGAAMQGLAYTAGVLTTFLSLAGLLIVLKAGGAAIGWGFQLQSPLVVALLAYLMAVVGLVLAGAVRPGEATEGLLARLSNMGGSLAGRTGVTGSFFTGMLAVLVAIGFAMTADTATGLAVFAALGMGLALPFLLLSIAPPLQRLLPRPGPWMIRFKEFMAFPMFATAAWLVWVLSLQTGSSGLLAVLLGFVLLALALWLLRFARPWSGVGAVSALVTALLLAALPATDSPLLAAAGKNPAATTGETGGSENTAVSWRPFTQSRLDGLLAENRPVFVEMTAAWCITCLVNERVALSSEAFASALETGDITYLRGDWTNADPEITAFLERFGRSGVPLYVLFPAAGGEPEILPQLLTETTVQRALTRAVRTAEARS